MRLLVRLRLLFGEPLDRLDVWTSRLENKFKGQGEKLKTAISLLITFLVLVSIPLVCDDVYAQAFECGGERVVTVGFYNEAVDEGNQCAELLRKQQELLNEADAGLEKCEQAECPNNWVKPALIGAGSASVVWVVIIILIILL